MLILWLGFPLVMLAVCLGLGLAVERLGGWRLPGALLPGIGLCLLIVSASLTTSVGQTAQLTMPVAVLLAVIGYAVSWPRLRALRPEPWAATVGIAIFAICAAPEVVTGNASFLGYFVDTDPGFHLELISWLLGHGHSLAGVPLSSSAATVGLLREYLSSGYPTGADVALGALRPLAGQDLAWIFAPYLAVAMAFSALALHDLLGDVIASRPLRAFTAFVAAQPGLVYAFYLKMSVKEIVVVLVITLTVLLVVRLARRPWRARELAALIVVSVAGLDTYSLTIVPWVGIPLAALTVSGVWRARQRGHRPAWRPLSQTAMVIALGLLLAAPVLLAASTFVGVVSTALGGSAALGNLAGPLSAKELLGIWPNGDYRFPTLDYPVAYGLMAIALLGVLFGLAACGQRRRWAPLLLLVSDAIATLYLLGRGSPYANSKVLMLASGGFVLAAMVGAASLHATGRRVAGWLIAGVVAFGVLWTNALAFHDSTVAPVARFRELDTIAGRFAHQGPAFYNLWDTFAVYFLRNESVAVPDTFDGPSPQRPGLPTHTFGQLSTPWDPNQLRLAYLETFRLLVLGRSPLGSRPPANYVLAYRGQYYDVWRRTAKPRVLEHLSFTYGYPVAPAPPACQTIIRAAALARGHGARLAYVRPPRVSEVVPTGVPHPAAWNPTPFAPGEPSYFLTMGQSSGTLLGHVVIPRAGRYGVWIQGSFSRRLVIRVGTRFVGSFRHQTGTEGQFVPAGTTTLPAGVQQVAVERPPQYYAPGNVIAGDLLGPLVIAPVGPPPPVQTLPAAAARSLCGQPLQWLEVIR